MSSLGALLVLLVAQANDPYVRSRVDNQDPKSHCLWWREADAGTRVVPFQQSALGNTETTGDTEFAAVTRSFQSWQAVLDSCGHLAFAEAPRTPERKVGFTLDGGDNRNLVVFRSVLCTDKVGPSDSCWDAEECQNRYDCWAYQRGTIALTTTTYERGTGEIYDADIEFNAYSFVFTTVDAPPCVAPVFNQSCVATDVQNTMTHEIGHLLGLDHTGRPGSTMNYDAKTGETSKRVIDSGSASFICEAYPKGRISRDCVVNPVKQTLGKAAFFGCSITGQPPLLWALGAAALWLRRRRGALPR